MLAHLAAVGKRARARGRRRVARARVAVARPLEHVRVRPLRSRSAARPSSAPARFTSAHDGVTEHRDQRFERVRPPRFAERSRGFGRDHVARVLLRDRGTRARGVVRPELAERRQRRRAAPSGVASRRARSGASNASAPRILPSALRRLGARPSTTLTSSPSAAPRARIVAGSFLLSSACAARLEPRALVPCASWCREHVRRRLDATAPMTRNRGSNATQADVPTSGTTRASLSPSTHFS